jgi:hypothetical protein
MSCNRSGVQEVSGERSGGRQSHVLGQLHMLHGSSQTTWLFIGLGHSLGCVWDCATGQLTAMGKLRRTVYVPRPETAYASRSELDLVRFAAPDPLRLQGSEWPILQLLVSHIAFGTF